VNAVRFAPEMNEKLIDDFKKEFEERKAFWST
jgi:hypothetical protein